MKWSLGSWEGPARGTAGESVVPPADCSSHTCTVRIICVLVASQDSSGTVTELQLPQLLWVLGVWAVLAQGRGGSRGDGGGT